MNFYGGFNHEISLKMIINNFISFAKKKVEAYKNYYESWKYERKLFSSIKCGNKKYKEYLRCQLDRTLSKKQRDDAYNRVKYLLSKFVEKVNHPKDAKILSVGCRNMYEIQAFHDMGFKNVTGIDLFSENKSILVMDMQNMTFEDNTFDVIFSCHSLEHTHDYKKAISEFVRVAKDGSVLVIEVPVNYETGGSDLWDFESLENLKKIFQPNTGRVLFEEYLRNDAKNNFDGTDIIRIIFKIEKEDVVWIK
ncbi:MAG: hypothetical protein A7315_02545 [Candidatus Altiarchaeales archaeon WOR_SM1_79]|nr:MAG: hypothetical protein A7315_02545 [Candidatus Altiarchaeales archaeon WOR_SM1_79]